MEIAGQDAELPEIRPAQPRLRGGGGDRPVRGWWAACSTCRWCVGETLLPAHLRRASCAPWSCPPCAARSGTARAALLATTRPSYDVVVTPGELTRGELRRLRAGAGAARTTTCPSWERLREPARARSAARPLTVAEDISASRWPRSPPRWTSRGQDRGRAAPALPARAAVRPRPRLHERDHRRRAAHAQGRGLPARRPDRPHRPRAPVGALPARAARASRRWWSTAAAARCPASTSRELVDGPVREEPVPGHNVVLTLDLDVQHIDRAGPAGKRAGRRRWWSWRCETGRVLAMVSRPTFDPNLHVRPAHRRRPGPPARPIPTAPSATRPWPTPTTPARPSRWSRRWRRWRTRLITPEPPGPLRAASSSWAGAASAAPTCTAWWTCTRRWCRAATSTSTSWAPGPAC